MPFRFRRSNALRARNGALQCSAGPEGYGYHGIIDTEASTWAPAFGRPSESAGCLAARKKKKKKLRTRPQRHDDEDTIALGRGGENVSVPCKLPAAKTRTHILQSLT